MRYKKQIVMICLITFLLLPFQKYEEPKAELLTLTTGAIVGSVALAVACGVVIANHETFEDVGTRVWEYVSAIPNAVEQVGDKIKFNITKGLIENLVPWLVDNIPRESVYLEQTIETNGNDWYTSKTIDLNTTDSSRVALFTAYGEKSDVIQVYYKSQSASDFFSIPISITISSSNPSAYFYTRYDSNEKCVTLNANGARQHNLSKEKYKFMEFKVIGASKIVDSVCIPYGSDVDELGSVSLDKPREYFPSGTGSISVPVNYPLDSYSPSVSAPIGSLNDLVLEDAGVVINTGDSTNDGVNDGVIDKPNVDVGETPTTGEGLWDTLLSWLSSLFAPLVSLLEWIGSILTSILDFLLGLLEKIKDLLIYLFVPSEGILVDALNGWRADLESKFGLDFSVIDGLQKVDEQGVKDIEFTIMGVDVVLPLSFVNKFASTSRTFTTGLVVIFLVWYQYRNAYKLLRNSEPLQGDGGGKK